MIIDLTKIQTYYINLKKHEDKNLSMINLGKDFGFKKYQRFNGIDKGDDPISGCAMSHYNILSTINEMSIILEDDCVIKNYIKEIEVPDDTDALYLGLSEWGYRKDSSKPGNFIFNKHSSYKHLYKIDSMLATHAILYISKEYINMCSRIAKYSGDNSVHVDQGFARVQRYYNVYAVSDPVFYQKSNKEATNISFVKDRIIHHG